MTYAHLILSIMDKLRNAETRSNKTVHFSVERNKLQVMEFSINYPMLLVCVVMYGRLPLFHGDIQILKKIVTNFDKKIAAQIEKVCPFKQNHSILRYLIGPTT